jgi:hypothetical protein
MIKAQKLQAVASEWAKKAALRVKAVAAAARANKVLLIVVGAAGALLAMSMTCRPSSAGECCANCPR